MKAATAALGVALSEDVAREHVCRQRLFAKSGASQVADPAHHGQVAFALWFSFDHDEYVHIRPHRHIDPQRDHPPLWSHAARLTGQPVFGRHLDLDAVARRHHFRCQGQESAGAAIPILERSAHVPTAVAAPPAEHSHTGR